MDKKNTMLLTVIAVATLLVAVVGATFAYFAISTDKGASSKATITGSTENTKVGSVALKGNENLTMNLTAEDMAKTHSGHTFYANDAGNATIDAEQKLTVGTATLSNSDSGIVYSCKAVYKVTYDDSDEINAGGITWEEDDAAVLKLYGADSNVTVTEDESYTSEGLKLSDLKEASTGGKTVNVTFKLTGGSSETATLQASLAIKNSESEQQGRLANKKFKVNLEATSFECDIVAS